MVCGPALVRRLLTGPDTALRPRHRPWLLLTAAGLFAGLGCLLLLGIPYVPIASDLSTLILPLRRIVKTPLAGVPLLALAYPLYVLACILLSLDALRRPGDTARMLGDLARRRAQPWLGLLRSCF